MPRIKSSVLDVRKNRKQREINRAGMSKLKSAVKKVRTTEEADAKKTAISQAYQVIDKAVKSGLIKKQTAARQKSRLSRTKKVKAA